MVHGLVDAIGWLRGLPANRMPAGDEVKGHRDGYATECPGDWLYGWIERGWPRPNDGAGKPKRIAVPEWRRLLEYPPPDGKGYMSGDDVVTWQKRMRERGWAAASP
jgi:hypothetical protein